jgi:hypothetical protein
MAGLSKELLSLDASVRSVLVWSSARRVSQYASQEGAPSFTQHFHDTQLLHNCVARQA